MILVDRASAASSSQKYTLILNNQTTTVFTLLCYQNQSPNLPSNCYPLAWFAQSVAPQNKAYFIWTEDYDFVWAKTGHLKPGVVFRTSETIPSDLKSNNQITFTRLPEGAFTFKDQTNELEEGSMYIDQDSTIPSDTASIGIGMSCGAIYAVQALPNAPRVVFKPTPTYYVAYVFSTEQGAVLNLSDFSESQYAQIEYPVNMYTATATLKPDNTWSIEYSAESARVNRSITELYDSLNSLDT